jgi:hypothetical protein
MLLGYSSLKFVAALYELSRHINATFHILSIERASTKHKSLVCSVVSISHSKKYFAYVQTFFVNDGSIIFEF